MEACHEQALLRQLQHAFRVVAAQHAVHVATLADHHDAVQSLYNLAEQYASCAEADLSMLSFSKLTGVREALLAKLITSMEALVTRLRGALNVLRDASAAIRSEVTNCMRVYEKHSDVISIQDTTMPHPFWPPLAVMLRQLHLIDRLVHNDSVKKEHSVKSVSYADFSSVEALQKAWRQDSKLDQKVNENLALVDFLLKEKL